MEAWLRNVWVPLAVAPAVALLPARVSHERMRQVAGNPLDNALRHTPAAGRVTLSVRRGAVRAVVEAADMGQGISAPRPRPRHGNASCLLIS